MNIRYFEAGLDNFWFGGGIDLTPHYVVDDDARFFHQSVKNVCDRFDQNHYPEFKKWADDYFFIKHRNETRGIGGIFFDHLVPARSKSKEDLFRFVMAVGESFVPIYSEIVRRNRKLEWSSREKKWQSLRRGRYVEFNLLYDRGTKFGLESDGRAESILMSLPPQAEWIYEFPILAGSSEEITIRKLKKGIDWLAPVSANDTK